jgi:hypothetical protein
MAKYLERRVGELDRRPGKDANLQKLDSKPKWCLWLGREDTER